MSTISSNPCFRIVKTLGLSAAIGAAAGSAVGALTYVSALPGAVAGAAFMVTMMGTNKFLKACFDEELTGLMKLIISVAAGIFASIVLTQLLTGVSIGFGAALLIDAAPIGVLLGLNWLCDDTTSPDREARQPGM